MVNCHLFTHETLRRLKNSWKGVLAFGSVGFEEREKPDYPQKNLSAQGREPTTNSTRTGQIIIVVIIIATFWSSSSSSWSWSSSSSLSSSASPSCDRQTLQLHKASKRLPPTFPWTKAPTRGLVWQNTMTCMKLSCQTMTSFHFLCLSSSFLSAPETAFRPHSRGCASWSRIREWFIKIKCSFRKPCD